MTQNEMIAKHLKTHGSITALEALQLYGIMRLGARIFDLKAQGYRIARVMTQSRNRWNEKTTYAKYIYLGGNDEQNHSHGKADKRPRTDDHTRRNQQNGVHGGGKPPIQGQ